MQDGVGGPRHGLRPHLAGGRPEQRQQLGGAAADVLVRAVGRVPDRLPGGAGLRDGLVRAGFVLAPDRDAQRLGRAVGPLDHPLFAAVAGSTTVTTPALALAQDDAGLAPGAILLPAEAGLVQHPPDGGRAHRRQAHPARVRSARCKVVSDQVAVPSASRSGGRRASRRMRARLVRTVLERWPPAGAAGQRGQTRRR